MGPQCTVLKDTHVLQHSVLLGPGFQPGDGAARSVFTIQLSAYARPSSTRGVTNTLPFNDASTTSRASPATSAPPRAPTSVSMTSAATRFDVAIRSSGSTWKNAALSAR